MLFFSKSIHNLFNNNRDIPRLRLKEYFLTCTNSFLFLLPENLKKGDTVRLEIIKKEDKQYVQVLKENFVVGFLDPAATEEIIRQASHKNLYARVTSSNNYLENSENVKISLL